MSTNKSLVTGSKKVRLLSRGGKTLCECALRRKISHEAVGTTNSTLEIPRYKTGTGMLMLYT